MPSDISRNPADFDILHVNPDVMQPVDPSMLKAADDPGHAPRVLLLYGSIRERSFSRLVAEESERLLKWQGCETRVLIHAVCRNLTATISTLRLKSCARPRCGPKPWFGFRQSATAR